MSELNAYLMGLARAVEAGADCLRGSVGVVIARDGGVLATGFNETPAGLTPCTQGGCTRCAEVSSGQAPANDDRCVCIHGEVNAVAAAARAGISLAGSTAYTTKQACTGCAKALLQAGVVKLYYEMATPSWLDYGADWPAVQGALAMEQLAEP